MCGRGWGAILVLMVGSRLRCPACSTGLVVRTRKPLAWRECPACGGRWFGAGVLLALVREMIARGEAEDADIELGKRVRGSAVVPEGRQPCPACSAPMEKLNYGYDSNVILDRCAPCAGTWADFGEVERVAQHAKGNPRLDALAKGFIKEFKALDKAEEELKQLAALFSP